MTHTNRNRVTTLDRFNSRCNRLLATGPGLGEHAQICHPRLVGSSQFQFAFRDFLPDAHNDLVVGRFFAAIKSDATSWRSPEGFIYRTATDSVGQHYRFFKIDIPMPGSAPVPAVEYNRGDNFEIHREWAVHRDQFPELLAISDDDLLAHLLLQRSALAAHIVAAILTEEAHP